MAEKITESIVNLTEEIRNITNDALSSLENSINTSLNDYLKKNDVKQNIDENSNDYPVTGKSIINYISAILNDYYDDEELEEILTNYVRNEKLNDYVKKTEFTNSLDQVIGVNLEGHSFKFPKETQTQINKLITAGYYKYVNNVISTFSCTPDEISYNNAIIRVERQNNHLIQHVYATSPDANNNYKIDGREFVRHGYLTENDDEEIVTNWDEWKVSHLPWRKRDDLLHNDPNNTTIGKGENVDDDSFHIYECTSGYVFQWTQKSFDKKFILPKAQYTYSTIYTFKDLPIPEPTIFSNYIGHMDLKISKGKVEIRSSSNKGEYIVGVDGNYFVPRTN